MRARRALCPLVLVAVAACGSRTTTPGDLTTLPPAADAPYELAADRDLEDVRASFDALPIDDAERTELRARLAAEYARRADRALEGRRLAAAATDFEHLISLWTADELAAGAPGLADHGALAHRLRDVFARAGADIEAVLALAVIALVDPAGRAAAEAEIDEIFAFADDLAVIAYGDGAQRARPIEILENAAESLPTPAVVDRLIDLYRERQKAVDSLFRRNGADLAIIQAHGQSVLRTAWHMVRILARAGRIAEAPAALESLHGIGDDSELRRRLGDALAADDAMAWVRLAAVFRADPPDLAAALALCRVAIERFPRDPSGYLAAADTARAGGSAALAIHFYERALELDPDLEKARTDLAELYEFRVTNLAFGDRPNAARRALEKLERFHEITSAKHGTPLEPDLANAYAAMGRGLVSLGDLDAGRDYLQRSLALRPTLGALESLGTVALKRQRFADAIAHLERALKLPERDLVQRFDRIKLMRLLADAHVGAGDASQAEAHRKAALEAWARLGRDAELAGPYLAESLAERGKLLWQLDRHDEAISAFDAAVGKHPDGSALQADLVSFLLANDQYRKALDVFHGAVANSEVDDYYKVYMSLWMVAEARRRDIAADSIATTLLHARDGRLWYDALARLATGRAVAEALREQANTRGRRAELLYYTAVLTPPDPAAARELLEEVVDSDVILFFEYEMAQQRLAASP